MNSRSRSGPRELDPYSPTYQVARERFREAALAARAAVDEHRLTARGPDGRELATDVASVGARRPKHAVVVSSGVHGVEAFFGSAVQVAWLRRLRAGRTAVPAGMTVVLVHAVNPYGFAWRRRTDEQNVDLNRNFLDRGESYAGVPAHYDRVHRLLNPPAPPPRIGMFRVNATLARWRHGSAAVRTAVAAGQYEHPSGLFFGGGAPAASTRLIQERFWDWTLEAGQVVHLDLHTGLGPFADCQLLIDPPLDRHIEWYREHFAGARVVSAADGGPYVARGVMGGWLARRAGSRRYRFACVEIGTYSPVRVLGALRAENRAERFSKAGAAPYERAKRELVECFCPANRLWRRKALAHALQVLDQAVTGPAGY